MPAPSAIVLLHPDFEELEAVAPIDILRRAGVSVCVASYGGGRVVVGRSGLEIAADKPFAEVQDALFDAFVIAGGPGVRRLRGQNDLMQALRAHDAAGKRIAAICAAPVLLKDAGILGNRRRACHASVAEELAPAADSPVVADGNLITAQGAGSACAFGLEIVRALCGAGAADEIARSIHFHSSYRV